MPSDANPGHAGHKGLSETLRSSLIMLAFGLGVLAFLVAIDRPHWFRLKPATGTAAAMSHAASSVASPTRPS